MLFARILDAVFLACAKEESPSLRLLIAVEEAQLFTKRRVGPEAKEAGVTKKVLKAKVKQHNYLKKADKCRTDLEADEQNEFDLIVQKLGGLAELPLGLAALNGAKGGGQHLNA